MAGGLLALLDDVAALTKVAAASVDDVMGQAAKAGSKAAGAVIDDAAVTPKYVRGVHPSRELPVVWRITKGSLRNKLAILLPLALLLSAVAPWAIAPLLMLGGAYLCFEGAEKVAHLVAPATAVHAAQTHETVDPAHLEEEKAKGAIKTDFILSAEIMTIALAAIPESGLLVEAATLAVIAVAITVLVYGAVAAIVKADDIGLAMARHGRLGVTRRLGRSIVKGMPCFLKALTLVGTVAMLWVGGAIMVHGLEQTGVAGPAQVIHAVAAAVAHVAPAAARAAVEWSVTAAIDGLLGLGLGLALMPVVARLIEPLAARVARLRSG